MSVTTTLHVNFRGEAREALEFYASVVGGDLVVATFADIGQVEEPSQVDQVAWGQVTTTSGFTLMAYDVQPSKDFDPGRNAFYAALRGSDAEEVQRLWQALAEGAEVLTPLGPSPFGPLYGMLTDRFGVTWIIAAAPEQGS